MARSYRYWCISLVWVAAVAPQAWGGSVTILNPGFESPVSSTFTTSGATNWTLSGSGGGVWNIGAAPLGFWNVVAPQGTQVGWLATSPSSAPASYSQTLSESVLSDASYVLSGQVGHPIGFGTAIGTTYTVELLAGASVVASTTGTGPDGKFAPFNLTWNSTGSPLVGSVLGIRLTSSKNQTAFDAISLDFTRNPTIIPLPAAAWMGLALLGSAAVPGTVRRFRVH